MFRYSLVLSGLVAAISLLCTVAETAELDRGFVIADSGQPWAQIIIGSEAAEPEWCAAEELQRAIEKISGVRLPVNQEPQEGLPSDHHGTLQSSVAVKEADL